MSKKVCQKCKAKLKDNAQFCPKCGRKQSKFYIPTDKAIIILGVLLIGIGLFKYVNDMGTTINDVKVEKNYSSKYSAKMLPKIYDKDKNVLYSDMTQNTVLALLYKEGNEKVKRELGDYFELDSDTIINNFDKFYERYKDGYKKVNYCSSLWINSKDKGISNNTKATADKLHIDVKNDFNVSSMNNWIKSKTNNRIKNGVSEEDLKNAHSILLSTLYFNETWAEEYENGEINDGIFHGTNGDTTVTFLDSKEDFYLMDDTGVGFMRPYKDEGLYFVGMIPHSGHTLDEIDIHRLLNSHDGSSVKVKIPEFEYEYELELIPKLKELGINSIFTPGNLDDISEGLYVSKIVQKNIIKVDRKGTEAISFLQAVNQTWGASLGPDATVYLDEPFIFLIYDENIKQVLFMGQVNNITK